MSYVPQILALWDFANPVESEKRFRQAQAEAEVEYSRILETQVARCRGLAGNFGEARALLSGMSANPENLSQTVQAFWWLELGRSYVSNAHDPSSIASKDRELARKAFLRALETSDALGEDYLAIDALHMMVLVDTRADEQLAWNMKALQRIESSPDPQSKAWEAALLNNIGYALHLDGRYQEALEYFARSKVAYLNQKDLPGSRVEDWMIAWTFRVMGRQEEALALQLRLEEENAQAGTPDMYVFDELATLFGDKGDQERWEHYQKLKTKHS